VNRTVRNLGDLRWGILGTASIADSVIPAIAKARCGTVRAVASRDGARARAWGGERNIPLSFGSYEALLRSGEVDVVYNPLPNRLHAQWTIRALEAGLPVLCEKPFASSAAEARAVADVARRTGLPVIEAFMYRYHPLWDTVREALRDGLVGELTSVVGCFTFRLDDPDAVAASPELAGGALMDVGCYPVHAARMVAGAEPLRAVAFERRTRVDDTFRGLLEFPGGVIASVECSIASHERHRVEISGTAGTIVMDAPWLPGEAGASFVLQREIEGAPRIVACPGDDPYRGEVLEFARAVVTRHVPRWGVEDAVANMAAIDALYASAALGRAVDVTIP
jgi:predicted dehydrogenase